MSEKVSAASLCEASLVLPEGDNLNSLFEELAQWEDQLKALDSEIPTEWEEPSP